MTDDGLLQEVTDAFNSSLRFDAEDTRMAYTVRDPIAAGIENIMLPYVATRLLDDTFVII